MLIGDAVVKNLFRNDMPGQKKEGQEWEMRECGVGLNRLEGEGGVGGGLVGRVA